LTLVPEPGLDAEARSAETRQARRAQPTRMSVGSGDFEYSREGRRINVYLIPSSARPASYGGPALRSFSEGGLYSPRVTDTQVDTPVDTWRMHRSRGGTSWSNS